MGMKSCVSSIELSCFTKLSTFFQAESCAQAIQRELEKTGWRSCGTYKEIRESNPQSREKLYGNLYDFRWTQLIEVFFCFWYSLPCPPSPHAICSINPIQVGE